MRLLIHNTLQSAAFAQPIKLGWIDSSVSIELREKLIAEDCAASDAALIPSPEIGLLTATHRIVPQIAIIAESMGPIAMRVPRRPDEIETSIVRFWETSSTAELLARAVIQAFYGILPTGWTTEADVEAQVIIVDGALAFQLPEAGFAEDLIRAWFILTGQPLVTHVLAVPQDASDDEVSTVIQMLNEIRGIAHQRRRELRRLIVQAFDLADVEDQVITMLNTQSYQLTDQDRRALIMFLQHGNKGSRFPYPWELPYLETGESAITQ